MPYSLRIYKQTIDEEIRLLFTPPVKKNGNKPRLNDVLLDDYIADHEEEFCATLRIKQLQMKTGMIWKIVIGNWPKFVDLNSERGYKWLAKYPSLQSLDTFSPERGCVLTIKNRYNTDNNRSRTMLMNRLFRVKGLHSKWKVIYGVINERDGKGRKSVIKRGDLKVEYLSGTELLRFIFGRHTAMVVEHTKQLMNSIILGE